MGHSCAVLLYIKELLVYQVSACKLVEDRYIGVLYLVRCAIEEPARYGDDSGEDIS